MEKLVNPTFWKGKRVFLTGHTGFKGAWMSRILIGWGAELTGYALDPEKDASLFSLSGVSEGMTSVLGDIRDLSALRTAYQTAQPDIVIHMAAQPIVRDSYNDPVYTYETNVMGTVYLLECVRTCPGAKSVLNVTTDKVYQNNEWEWGYREIDPLDGYDPYSNSKSCSELVTHGYRNSFFTDGEVAISTARAGNVIGGGDFAKDRILPDCVRAVQRKEKVVVRNPYSIRPYQHVLEPVLAYLMISERQYTQTEVAGYYNIGPEDADCITTGRLVDLFCEKWGESQAWESRHDGGPHEANFLKLDCSRAKSVFGWHPAWRVETAVEKLVEWTKTYLAGEDVQAVMDAQIESYLRAAAGRSKRT